MNQLSTDKLRNAARTLLTIVREEQAAAREAAPKYAPDGAFGYWTGPQAGQEAAEGVAEVHAMERTVTRARGLAKFHGLTLGQLVDQIAGEIDRAQGLGAGRFWFHENGLDGLVLGARPQLGGPVVCTCGGRCAAPGKQARKTEVRDGKASV